MCFGGGGGTTIYSSFYLEVEASALYSGGNAPTLDIIMDGSVVSSASVTGSGTNTLGFRINYEGTSPSGVRFRFNGGSGDPGDQITIENVRINGQSIGAADLTATVLAQSQTSDLNVGNNDHLFGRIDPAVVDLGTATQSGTAGNDELEGGNEDDVIDGDDGDDFVFTLDGDDAINGGDGNDMLFGQGGNDIVIGGAGNDRVWGDEGDDLLYGQDDNDFLFGENGNDTLNGGDGNDVLIGGDGNDILFGDAGDDRLVGTSGTNFMNGDEGDDTILGGSGDDTIYGGEDDDTIHGGAGDDYIEGEDGDDIITGGAGDDELYGGDGDDMLSGGLGIDILDGGGGSDTFIFSSEDSFDNVDEIRNFSRLGGDAIDISDILSDNGYDSATHTITDWIDIITVGGGSEVRVDIGGGGAFGAGTLIATVDATGLTNILTMITNGNLITV